jgi:molecular chaperone GrpE
MENKEQENAWRISYAEKLVRKTESYRKSLRTPQPDSVLGIYMDTQIRVSRWIETMLTLNDQLEYGIAGAERTTKRTEYQREKLLMMDFRKILKRNLYRLHITPVEANGESFDPYIHEALQTEETDLVEEGRVIRETQKGYFFGEKLYRPARVIVSRKSAGK